MRYRIGTARAISTVVIFVTAILVTGFTSGCIEIDGGAVEARWVLRTPRGHAIGCDDAHAKIDTIRFVLQPEATNTNDPCADNPNCTFDCSRGVGTTPFSIPDGNYMISLQPRDETGSALGASEGVTVPAALYKSVITGELTNLNVNLVIVDR